MSWLCGEFVRKFWKYIDVRVEIFNRLSIVAVSLIRCYYDLLLFATFKCA